MRVLEARAECPGHCGTPRVSSGSTTRQRAEEHPENGSPVSHMKYAVDSKDTDAAFYLPGEMEMSNIRYSRTSTDRKHGYVENCVAEVIHTDTRGCNCSFYNSTL